MASACAQRKTSWRTAPSGESAHGRWKSPSSPGLEPSGDGLTLDVDQQGRRHSYSPRSALLTGRFRVGPFIKGSGRFILGANHAFLRVIGLSFSSALPGSHDNSIDHNIACSVTSTASIALGGSSNDNNIHHNIATTISSFGTGNEIHHNITRLPIVDSSGGGNSIHDNMTIPSVCF